MSEGTNFIGLDPNKYKKIHPSRCKNMDVIDNLSSFFFGGERQVGFVHDKMWYMNLTNSSLR